MVVWEGVRGDGGGSGMVVGNHDHADYLQEISQRPGQPFRLTVVSLAVRIQGFSFFCFPVTPSIFWTISIPLPDFLCGILSLSCILSLFLSKLSSF